MAGFISEADAAILLSARDVLLALQRSAVREAIEADGPDALSLGRFAESCNVARDSVYDTLAVADSYLDDGVAAAAVRS